MGDPLRVGGRVTLSMLNASGWVWLFLTVWSGANLIAMRDASRREIASNGFGFGLALTWLLWLVTP